MHLLQLIQRMTENKKKAPVEFRTNGILAEKGVLISDQCNIDALSSRGYGTLENKHFTLTFYESLYLLDKCMLEIKDEKGKTVDFQSLLQCYETKNDNAWVNYSGLPRSTQSRLRCKRRFWRRNRLSHIRARNFR